MQSQAMTNEFDSALPAVTAPMGTPAIERQSYAEHFQQLRDIEFDQAVEDDLVPPHELKLRRVCLSCED
jgi:hypothetical protein